jgi:hypothetical protein
MPEILEPLSELRDTFQILSGLAHRCADANGDGPGDHARASATFLTGCQARKTASSDVRAGVSIDQVVARHLGQQTRFASLELGCDKGRQAGACDSGYSCAYQFNLAWKSPELPLPPEVDPRAVFERLFGGHQSGDDAAASEERRQRRLSILDFVQADARRLTQRLSSADRQKMEQYLDSVREVEQQIERKETNQRSLPAGSEMLDQIPESYTEHIRLMYDLATLAFVTDSTRVITLMIAHDGSNRSYPFIGVPEGHHDMTHHGGDEAKRAKVTTINRFHIEQFGYLLKKLREADHQGRSLLDQAMIVYGSGISDGNQHLHDDLPVLLAGRGGASWTTGRHVRFPKDTPMSNLYVAMMQQAGIPIDSFGDSTGSLSLS